MMPEQPARPLHPLEQCTTFELRDYRRELEHALKHLPEHAPVRELLRQRLDAVLSEESSRAAIRSAR